MPGTRFQLSDPLTQQLQFGRRGQQYLTLAYQVDTGAKRSLWIGKERTEANFREFFQLLGPEVIADLK
jgi:hypothetical protein